ncbi:hypothetical protein [Lysinibacillus sp. SGAir0095]|nr:hypothetical protein [Lysinibacillus sp. SGAir0095]
MKTEVFWVTMTHTTLQHFLEGVTDSTVGVTFFFRRTKLIKGVAVKN